MPILPDESMVETATRIIDFLGDAMDFQRCSGGNWVESISAAKVHIQPRVSSYERSIRGKEILTDFIGFAATVADIRIGDRTTINGTYYIVDALENRGTHLEFGLRQTDEIIDA